MEMKIISLVKGRNLLGRLLMFRFGISTTIMQRLKRKESRFILASKARRYLTVVMMILIANRPTKISMLRTVNHIAILPSMFINLRRVMAAVK